MSLRWIAVAGVVIGGVTAAGWGYLHKAHTVMQVGSSNRAPAPSVADVDQWGAEIKEPARSHPVLPISRRSLPFDLGRDQTIPDGTADALLNRLTPLATAGDEVAARQLYLVLHRCRSAYAEDVSPQTYKHVDPRMYEGTGLTREAFIARFEASRLSSIEKTMAWCEGVSQAQVEQRGHWLRMAAEKGDITARLIYASDSNVIIGDARAMLANPAAVQAYREDVMRYMYSVADLGIPEGLQQLARIYENGILTEKNPVLAYAYNDVLNGIMPTPYDAETRQRMARGMTPQQREQAQHEADRIRAALRESAAR